MLDLPFDDVARADARRGVRIGARQQKDRGANRRQRIAQLVRKRGEKFILAPIGIAQAIASVNTGLWYARSAEFLQQPWLEQLRWLRIVGDTVFLVGVGAFAWFMTGLWRGWSYEPIDAPQPLREPLAKPVPSRL